MTAFARKGDVVCSDTMHFLDYASRTLGAHNAKKVNPTMLHGQRVYFATMGMVPTQKEIDQILEALPILFEKSTLEGEGFPRQGKTKYTEKPCTFSFHVYAKTHSWIVRSTRTNIWQVSEESESDTLSVLSASREYQHLGRANDLTPAEMIKFIAFHDACCGLEEGAEPSTFILDWETEEC